MLKKNPRERISAKEALLHPFFMTPLSVEMPNVAKRLMMYNKGYPLPISSAYITKINHL
jgi:hypothetical protein